MPGDLIISDSASSAAPKDTLVPAPSRYIVKQVQALYSDNGAVGAWLPALEIVSDAGIVTGRYVGTSVAAGSGQEVTWFPLGSRTPGGSGGNNVNVYSDGAFVATEPGIDFEDGVSVSWSFADNPGGGYVSVTPSGPYYGVAAGNSPALTLVSGVAKELGMVNAATGGGLVTTHNVGGLTGFGVNDPWPAFCQAIVTWPAGNYSRYVEIVLDNPIVHGAGGAFPTPMRFAAATTPEGDQMTAFAFVVAAAGGSPIRLNAWQNSGVNQSVAVTYVVYASLMREA